MTRYIALLRGINVGGIRKILMNDLRHLFISLDFSDAITYIQSGNVIFRSASREDTTKLANRIEQSIFKSFGFEVPVIVITSEELEKAISENPFLKQENPDIERLLITFLKETPEPDRIEKLKSYDDSPNRFQIVDNNIFLYCQGKYSESKLGNNLFESKLKVPATTRNWKTVLMLSKLSKSM